MHSTAHSTDVSIVFMAYDPRLSLLFSLFFFHVRKQCFDLIKFIENFHCLISYSSSCRIAECICVIVSLAVRLKI